MRGFIEANPTYFDSGWFWFVVAAGCRAKPPVIKDCKCMSASVAGRDVRTLYTVQSSGVVTLGYAPPDGLIECHAKCGCEAQCVNFNVSSGAQFPLCVFRTRAAGWCVFACSNSVGMCRACVSAGVEYVAYVIVCGWIEEELSPCACGIGATSLKE